MAAVALIGTILERAPRARHVITGYLALVVLAAPSHMFVAYTGGIGIADAFIAVFASVVVGPDGVAGACAGPFP